MARSPAAAVAVLVSDETEAASVGRMDFAGA